MSRTDEMEEEHMKRIIDDVRRIKAIYHNGPGWGYVCGSDKSEHESCDDIEPYEENGEMAPQTWFAIYKGGAIWRRVSGKDVTVEY